MVKGIPHWSAERRAMDALYAFMRVTDDLADEAGANRQTLAAWRTGLLAAFDGEFTHPVHPALNDTVRRFTIPPQLLLDVIDGLLNKGVVLNADVVLALANVDLVYLRLSALLCAADRVMPKD